MQFYPAPPSAVRRAERPVLLRRHRSWSSMPITEAPEPDDEPIEDEDFEDEDLLVGAIRRTALEEESTSTIAVGTLAVDGPHDGRSEPVVVRLLAAAGGIGIVAPSNHPAAPRRRAEAVRPGPTVFAVDGNDADEMVLIRLDSAPATIVRLALRADERGPVDGTPSNSVQGTTETSVVDLAPGHYLLLCRVSGRLPSALSEQTSAVA